MCGLNNEMLWLNSCPPQIMVMCLNWKNNGVLQKGKRIEEKGEGEEEKNCIFFIGTVLQRKLLTIFVSFETENTLTRFISLLFQ